VTGTTSSTPELTVEAGGIAVAPGATVPGRGDLRVRLAGCAPGGPLELAVGEQRIALLADADGRATWIAPGLLDLVAGEVRVAVGDIAVSFSVRPEKLTAEAIGALLADLEAFAEGLSQSAGSSSTVAGLRSRDRDLWALDAAIGLAASAAPAIRRRPVHRAREVVRAVARETGPRTAADVRWLATHPVHAVRAAASGRAVGVSRERRADLDTLENRGVLAAYDRMEDAADRLRGVVEGELRRLDEARPTREAFLTERGNLWTERDLPRQQALGRRRDQLDGLRHEIGATRVRAGLPDLRPRGPRMIRTPRIDAEPAYWATFRAFELATSADADQAPASAAPVRTLDQLWEQWCTLQVAAALVDLLGPPDHGRIVDLGWVATLRTGEVASWSGTRRTVRVSYEPEYAFGAGELRKLYPGRPWRPDLVVEVRWADGTVDLHVLDAKYRREAGSAPWTALQEIWWKYGEGIGDAALAPTVRSVWVVWPGRGIRLVGPAMLRPAWPLDRLRGGTLGLTPGERTDALAAALDAVLRLDASR
jgi:hypothetical protein